MPSRSVKLDRTVRAWVEGSPRACSSRAGSGEGCAAARALSGLADRWADWTPAVAALPAPATATASATERVRGVAFTRGALLACRAPDGPAGWHETPGRPRGPQLDLSSLDELHADHRPHGGSGAAHRSHRPSADCLPLTAAEHYPGARHERQTPRAGHRPGRRGRRGPVASVDAARGRVCRGRRRAGPLRPHRARPHGRDGGASPGDASDACGHRHRGGLGDDPPRDVPGRPRHGPGHRHRARLSDRAPAPRPARARHLRRRGGRHADPARPRPRRQPVGLHPAPPRPHPAGLRPGLRDELLQPHP